MEPHRSAHGRTDIPLTDAGRKDAAQLGSWLARRTFDRVFTSPLQRAVDTCELAGYGDAAQVHDTACVTVSLTSRDPR